VDGELVDAPETPESAEPVPAAARSPRRVWIAGLVTSLVLAGFVSFYASASPDGLEKVAADHGIDQQAEEHAVADSPLADYGVKDVENARLSGGLAGVIGVGVTVVAGSAVFWLVRRRRTPDVSPTSTSTV
jgi:cobalt/nickel transport system permease protein